MQKIIVTIFFMLSMLVTTSPSFAVPVTLGSNTVEVGIFVGSYANNGAELQSTAWWGNAAYASSAALQVANLLGDNSHAPSVYHGPFFTYDVGLAYAWNGAGLYSLGYSLDSGFTFATSASQVPEPASLALLGIALAGLGATRRRKQI